MNRNTSDVKINEGDSCSDKMIKYTDCELGQRIFFTTLLAAVIAAPLNLEYNAYMPFSKSTLTSSSHVVDHGSTHVLHAPVLAHEVEYHAPVSHAVIAPVSHTVVAHAPVTHTIVSHAPVYSLSSNVEYYKSPDSSITHQSSSIYNSAPFYAFH
ncbi:unnamed protein product, partial [Brenthis ino]